MRRPTAILLLAALLAHGDSSMAAVRSIQLSLPREYGFFIGDTLESDVAIEVDAGTRLMPASLPAVGRVTYWLDLRNVTLETVSGSQSVRYRLKLRYQTFYAPLDTRRLKIPGFELSFETDDQQVKAKVPEWSFVTSSLREISPGGTNADELLAPDLPAQPLPLRMAWIRLLILACLLAGSLGLLAHHRAWWPFHRRPARPFARAARALAREHDATQGMAILHRAFDRAFGRRLLTDDLPDFLFGRPEMQPLAADIDQFFNRSRDFFFGAGEPIGHAAMQDLVTRLARAERGGR